MSSPTILLENVSVRYRVPRERVSGIKEYAIRWAQRRLRYEDFWALKGVSFEVPRGEAFGVIGRNGSGKSTLLKTLARVLKPVEGRVRTVGRVAPLLELGAGFHPELSGRENVYLNSALLGRTARQSEQLLPEIIEFAEIGEFLDAPIRTYSTGMIARLGFAIATCQRPDILLVDEVLSVGDAQFQQKCLDRMLSFQAQGTTILIVTHSMGTVQSFCERALWLDHGCPAALGPVNEVIEQYVKMGSPEVEKSVGGVDAAKLKAYTALPSASQLYPVELLNPAAGAFSVWIKLRSDRPFRDVILFHSEDSRYVVYLGSYFSESDERQVKVLAARAGGNRRALDTYFGTSVFPEVSTALAGKQTEAGTPFREDLWHHVVAVWHGHPHGRLWLYVDGQLVGERAYDSRNDDHRPWATTLALGFRPPEWTGERVEQEDGSVAESRPESALSVADSAVEMRAARLYRAALGAEEIQQIYTAG